MAIRSFKGTFLSNFYGLALGQEPISIVFEGVTYPTVEHAFVAAKVADVRYREEIRLLATPSMAKRFIKDRGLEKRPNWRGVKVGIMEDLVRQKFSNPKLAAMLLSTGDEELIEGNDWNDIFWGVDAETGEGQNQLGRILMKIRAELRKA